MHSVPASDRFLRIHTLLVFMLMALVFAGPVFDWVWGVQAVLGRINNLSMVPAALYILLLFAVPRGMREGQERKLLLTIAILMLYAIVISLARYADWIDTFGGLAALMGSISAGFGAYILGKSGKGLHRRLVVMMIATLPALAVPIAMIALDPEAYEHFWLNVYGYSNIRAFGYFAAATTVLITGLAASSFESGRIVRLLCHFTALILSWSFLLWSGSRAGMVASVVAIIIGLAFTRGAKIVVLPFTLLSGALGAALSTLYVTPDRTFGLLNRVQDTAASLAEGGVTKASSNRIEMWQWAWGKILETPFLGRGYLPMAGMRDEGFNFYHTHNIVIEYLLSFGLIAGSAMLVLGAWVWFRAIIAGRRIGTPIAQALMMLVTLLPIYAMFSATLFFPYHLMVFMLGLGALLGWDAWNQRPEEAEEVPFKPKAEWMFEDLEIAGR